MMGITHAILSATGVSLFCQTSNPMVIGLAIIGSQIPDLDSTKSLIGQICFPLSEWLEANYPHRTITHCMAFNLGLTLISFGVWFFVRQEISITAAIALPLGHLLSIFSDTFTKKGVQLFYPLPVWCVCGRNPRRRLKTGGNAEFLVIGVTVLVLIASLNLNNQGGLKTIATDTLNLKDNTISQTYNENAASSIIWADFQGYRKGDRQKVDGRFLVVGEDGGYVLMDKAGITYKVGTEVIEEQIKLTTGRAVGITQISERFDDVEVSGVLNNLKSDYDGGLILLSGSLDVDYPEKARPVQSVKIQGNQAILNYTNIDQAIAALSDQWAIGELEVKVFSLNPWESGA